MSNGLDDLGQSLLQHSFSTFYFLFNRLGVDKSSKPNEPKSGLTIFQNIYEPLSSLELKPPYIIVAHLVGGLLMNLCTRTYQQEVAGIFVVDSPYSDEVAEIKNSKLSLLLKDMD